MIMCLILYANRKEKRTYVNDNGDGLDENETVGDPEVGNLAELPRLVRTLLAEV